MSDQPTIDESEGVHEVREEISQALSAYLRDTPIDEQSAAGFAKHLTKS